MIGLERFFLLDHHEKSGSDLIVYATSREMVEYWFDLPREGLELVTENIDSHPRFLRFKERSPGIVPEVQVTDTGMLKTINSMRYFENQLKGKEGVPPPVRIVSG